MLEVIRSADAPMAVAELAAAVGLHVTTARFHLDLLQRAQLVRRVAEPEGGAVRRGRPRQLFVATVESEPVEDHRELAAVLARVLAAESDSGVKSAEEAGRQWAVAQVPVEDALSWEDGTRRVGQLFERLGFAPRLVDRGPYRHLELDGCPFRDLAREFPQVVCSVHLGLLQEALRRLRVPTGPLGVGLRPFVQPDLCVADLSVPVAA